MKADSGMNGAHSSPHFSCEADMHLKILVLPGDGIGPEVTREAVRVLRQVTLKAGHSLDLVEGLVGGAALREADDPLPQETRHQALAADAVLLGAVGLPEFDEAPPARRPEKGLLDLRRLLGVYANLRPVKAMDPLPAACPLKSELAAGTDLIIVRELTGGLYYGEPRGRSGEGDAERAFNTMAYSRPEIRRVARIAFELASRRKKKVTSVDKSNVLECSQLWRQVVQEETGSFPGIALEHMLVDNCAMQLILHPRRFDVVLMENMFGDILSDEASVLAGSIGLLPSASLGDRLPSGFRRGLYEPVHGSAPDIAGRGIANPLGTIGSVAALLRYTFGLEREADLVEQAMNQAMASGQVTRDLNPASACSTAEAGTAVCRCLENQA